MQKLPLFIVIAALPFLLTGMRARADETCEMLSPAGGKAQVHVELPAGQPEKAYCVRVEKGQHLAAEISNPQGVEPSGRVISPSGEMDGGPGGSFYKGQTQESGTYRIEVGQRGPKRAGSCDLTVKITPQP